MDTTHTGMSPDEATKVLSQELGFTDRPQAMMRYCSKCEERVPWGETLIQWQCPITKRPRHVWAYQCVQGHEKRFCLKFGHVAWKMRVAAVDPLTGQILAEVDDVISQDCAADLARVGAFIQATAVWPHFNHLERKKNANLTSTEGK